MSAKVRKAVWRDSKQKGSLLLLLLAVADLAGDDGVAAPLVSELAKMTRLSERCVQYMLARLERRQELVIQRCAGPKGRNVLQVKTLHPDEVKTLHPENFAPQVQHGCTPGENFAPHPERKKSNQKKESTNSIPLTVNNSNPGDSATKSRPTKVAEEFSISEDMREWANAEGFDNNTIERETVTMVDYFRGTGKPMLDWVAVWRNWLRRSRRFNGNGNGRGQTKVDRTIQNAQNLLRRIDQQDRCREQRGTQRSNDGGLLGAIDLPFDSADGSGHDPHD